MKHAHELDNQSGEHELLLLMLGKHLPEEKTKIFPFQMTQNKACSKRELLIIWLKDYPPKRVQVIKSST